ncbi:MAG TPA: valine--tRNA ligase [Caulobacteraceae bacterium]|nr:valine--tRNA ligase [Caulobacteraceae bacterium]
MLEKTFDPAAVEPRLYATWEASGVFAPTDDPDAPPFAIVIPPPNVTGQLHIGHALNNTLQDVLIRFQRMRGRAALWLPGTDHAGIATQMMVERQLAEQGNIGRRELGREAFIEKVWEWKGRYGGAIVQQLRRLGASCDWSRERFTLDEGLSAAVRKVFVTLHKQGLIYRAKRLVNWQPELQTAVSDLEVVNIEVAGHMWRIRYPIEGEPGRFIVVATTRPETMLGDTAVAVHPDDERYKELVGKRVRLPLTDRLIPIVADDYADPEKGTGAVKITPAHDFNDFRVGQRHDLPLINVLTPDAKINDAAPAKYRGLDRFAARKQIVADLEEAGLLEGVDANKMMVPYDEKSKLVVIEPYLTDQWWVDAATLAQPAIRAVEQGKTVFQPKVWEKTYFDWMRNIEPWCVSRQLWWGHRIPAWFGPDGTAFVEETEEAARAAARAHYGKDAPLTQDEDVLDTWFSSGLWAFSTLGWPNDLADVKRFYPTGALITGFDIIFFWVARMMMLGIHFMGDVPFHKVVVNALIRDEHGQKMSKTKGNVVDPLELIDDYGADAVRFTMAALSGQQRNISLSRQRIEGYRNFGTKLWNAARFCQMNGCERVEGFDPASVKHVQNRWIRGEALKVWREVTDALENADFAEAAAATYRFVWNVFCDWRLELAKPVLAAGGEAAAETRAMTAWTLDLILKLLHPIMPFMTEELWEKTAEAGPPRDSMLITAAWPELPDSYADAAAAAEMALVIAAIGEGRSVRSELNVPNGARPALLVAEAGPRARRILEENNEAIRRLLGVDSVRFDGAADASALGGAVPYIAEGVSFALPVAAFIDLAAERARLAKETARLAGEIERTAKKLGNPDFIARAPEEVVEENRERLAEAEIARDRLAAALRRLEGLG